MVSPLDPLPEADARRFAATGCLVVRGLLAGTELERLRARALVLKARAQAELPAGMRYFTGRRPAESLTREERVLSTWGVDEITRPEWLEPELVDALGHPGVARVLHGLLEGPRAWGLKLLWTPKLLGYDLFWHRDQVKHDLYDWVGCKPMANDHVQFNLALNRDHCFLFVPGSHRRALTAREWEVVARRSRDPLPGEEEVALEPGDAVFMDAHALHRGRGDIEGNRLTLHFSCQAAWVPLKPWGSPGNLDWLTSEAFLSRLAPGTRPFYERLRMAEPCEDAVDFIRQAARARGWHPGLLPPAPSPATDPGYPG